MCKWWRIIHVWYRESSTVAIWHYINSIRNLWLKPFFFMTMLIFKHKISPLQLPQNTQILSLIWGSMNALCLPSCPHMKYTSQCRMPKPGVTPCAVGFIRDFCRCWPNLTFNLKSKSWSLLKISHGYRNILKIESNTIVNMKEQSLPFNKLFN